MVGKFLKNNIVCLMLLVTLKECLVCRYSTQYEDTPKSEPHAYIDNNTKGTQ